MNLQKMYAIGKVVYVDMDRYESAKYRLCVYDKHGEYLPITENSGGVLKILLCASKKLSIEIYEGS